MTSSQTFDTYARYREALLEALGQATQSIVIFDPDLRNTGLESPEGISALESFCLRVRVEESLRIAVHSASYIERNCPRLLNLVSRFGHRMQIRITSSAFRSIEQPFMIVDGVHLVTRFHRDNPRGKVCIDDAQSAFALLSQFESLWAAAQRGPSGIPLGI